MDQPDPQSEQSEKDRRREELRERLKRIRDVVVRICAVIERVNDLQGVAFDIGTLLQETDVKELLPARAQRNLSRTLKWLERSIKRNKPALEACSRLTKSLDYADTLLSRDPTLLDKVLDQIADKVLDKATDRVVDAVTGSADLVLYGPPLVKVVVGGAIIAAAAWGGSEIVDRFLTVDTFVFVAPQQASIEVNEEVDLFAEVRDESGNAVPGRPIVWTSTDPSIAPVSSDGIVNGVAPGQVEVFASSNGIVSNGVQVTVTLPRVASLSVSLDSVEVEVGEGIRLAATLADARGNELPGRPVTWTSSNPQVAAVGPDGTVRGVAEGSAEVTAEAEGISASAGISVVPVPVARVEVAFANRSVAQSIKVGQSLELRVAALDGNGNALDGRPVNWVSRNPDIAAVSPSGIVTGRAEGEVEILAEVESVTGSITVSVEALIAPDVEVDVSSVIVEGNTFSADVTFTDPDSNNWRVEIDYGDGFREPLTLSADNAFDLQHTYSEGGSYTVSVTITDDDGNSSSTSIPVTIEQPNEPPEVVVPGGSISEGGAFLGSGLFTDADSESWTATVNYGDGSPEQSLVLNPNRSFSLSHTYPDDGAYTITVTVRDEEGDSGSGLGTVRVAAVAPEVDAGAGGAIDEGDTFAGSGSFTDPGADRWIATVNYGDGSPPQALALGPSKAFGLSHTYADDGAYTVTVEVTDEDDGLSGFDSATVLVSRVGPQPDAGPDVTIDEDDIFERIISFADAGDDRWTATIDYGDGSSTDTRDLSTTRPFAISHVYAADGVYFLTVAIRDVDDNLTNQDTARITVRDVTEPELAAARTGVGWDSVGRRYVSDPSFIQVIFRDSVDLDPASISASDFVVEGHTVVSALWFDMAPEEMEGGPDSPNPHPQGPQDVSGQRPFVCSRDGSMTPCNIDGAEILRPASWVPGLSASGIRPDENRFAMIRNSVFIRLGRELGAGETPLIRIVPDGIGNVFGNRITGGGLRAEDFMPPRFSVLSTTSPVPPGADGLVVAGEGDEVELVAASDEDLVSPPGVAVSYVDCRDFDDGCALVTGLDLNADVAQIATNTFLVSVTPPQATGYYSVFISGFDGSPQNNAGSAGIHPDHISSIGSDGFFGASGNINDSDAIFFEGDVMLPYPQVLVSGQNIIEDPRIEFRTPLFVQIDFTEPFDPASSSPFEFLDEAAEYHLDNWDEVELTLFEIDGADLLSLVTTSDNRRFTVALEDISLDAHVVQINARDRAGNELIQDLALEFEIEEKPPFELTIFPGTNLISLPAAPVDTAIDSVFGPGVSVTQIATFDPKAPGGWLVAARDSPSDLWQGALTKILPERGYYVLGDRPATVEVGLVEQEVTSYELLPGWNLIGVSIPGPAPSMNAEDYLSSIAGEWGSLMHFDSPSGEWLEIAGDGPLPQSPPPGVSDDPGGSFDKVEEGKAYWIYVEDDALLTPK